MQLYFSRVRQAMSGEGGVFVMVRVSARAPPVYKAWFSSHACQRLIQHRLRILLLMEAHMHEHCGAVSGLLQNHARM